MYELNFTQRFLVFGIGCALLAAVGVGRRRSAAPPAIAFTAHDPLSGGPMRRYRDGSGGVSRSGGATLALAGKTGGAGVLIVHVAGDVKNPGVYALKPGRRIVDAIHAAGGPRKQADLDSINLAAPLMDGQQIRVRGKETDRGSPRRSAKKASALESVAVNAATAEELDALPGVGPATAQKIIEYRNQNGPFASAEDLLNVKGIGPKKLEKMRPYLQIP